MVGHFVLHSHSLTLDRLQFSISKLQDWCADKAKAEYKRERQKTNIHMDGWTLLIEIELNFFLVFILTKHSAFDY